MDVSKRSLFATYPHTGRVTAVQYFNEYILTVSIPCKHSTIYWNSRFYVLVLARLASDICYLKVITNEMNMA